MTAMVLAAMVLATGCGSGRPAAATKANPYERQPIREVTEAQLEEDGMLIDALTLQETGREDEALTAYGKVVERFPGCDAAWYGMTQLLAQRGWSDSAEACARRAVALEGDNVWYLLSLAMTQQMKNDNQGAVATWETIVRQNPEVLDYYYELSNRYIAAGDLPKAVESPSPSRCRKPSCGTPPASPTRPWPRSRPWPKPCPATSRATPSWPR